MTANKSWNNNPDRIRNQAALSLLGERATPEQLRVWKSLGLIKEHGREDQDKARRRLHHT